MSIARTSLRTTGVAFRAMLVFTVVLGLGYTFLITGIGQLALPAQANGSIARDASGMVVGSTLIGQSFTDADGNPLPQYFQSRPSAAGTGYDASSSGGSNLGPENPDLITSIEERRAAIAAFEKVDPAAVPADALTTSASGLDPDISPAYALLQVDRVAAARGIPADEVRALVESKIQSRDLGFLGNPRVNVLALNVALDALKR
ncbi:MAG: potassium-transporting ATPase subunit KdpC [Actinobacteria bacterium]|nr:potassium-transporting ATPase subunit KdpC [Actinomycetota bacterium]